MPIQNWLLRGKFTLSLLAIWMMGIAPDRMARGEEAANIDDKPIRVIELSKGDVKGRPPVITCVQVSPNGKILATGGDDHFVRLWKMEDGEFIRKLDEHTDWVRTVDFSNDGLTLATAGDGRRVQLWDVATGNEKKSLPPHPVSIFCVAYARDGKMLATAGFEDKLRIYDAGTGQLAKSIDCPCHDMRTVVFSPDASRIAAAGRNGKIRVWSMNDGKVTGEVDAHNLRIRSLAFSPNGTMIASTGEDRQVRVWNADTGAESLTLNTPPGKMMALVFIGDNQLATAGTDNLIHLWDLKTRKEITTYVGHTGSVATLAVEENLGVLVSGSFDTTVRVWRLNRPKNETTRREDGTEILK